MRQWHRMGLVVVTVGLLSAVAWTQEGKPERERLAEFVQFAQQLLRTGHPIDTLQHILQEGSGTAPSAEPMVVVLNLLVREVYQAGVYNLAFELATQTRTYAEKQLGPGHPQALRSLNNLALLYQMQGRYGEAARLYQDALATSEQVLGDEDPDTLASLNNLAVLYQAQGRYGEADPLYHRALEIRERVLGAEHPDTLASLNNLGYLYQAQGRYGEAEPRFQRALTLSMQVLGTEHPQTLTSLNNLANLYQAQERYREAEQLYQDVLASRERVLGTEHPQTLTSLNNLANLYQAQERYREAEPLYHRALASREGVLGAKHPQTLTSLNNLANLYQAQGRYGKAAPLFQRVLLTSERELGAEHPQTLTSLNSLAGLYWAQGRYRKAEPLYRRALASRERVLGAEHPDTLTTQLNYAVLLVAYQQPRRALQQLKLLEPRLLEFARVQLHTTLQEQVRRRFLVSHSTLQDVVYTLAVRHRTLPEARAFAAEVFLRWKQVQRDEDAYLEGLIRTSDDPVVKRLGQEIRELRRDLSHLAHAPQPDPDTLSDRRRLLEAKEVALTQHSRRYKRHLVVRGVRLDEVRTHLPQGSALLELRVYYPVDFTARKRGELHWLALLLPAVTGGKQELVLQDLGPVTDSVKRWEALRQRDNRESAAQLYQSLFGALDAQLQRFPTLYIAPDSFMHLVALSRLVLPDGRYWAERQTLRQLQTGRDLIPDDAEAVPKGLLALGGIDYEEFTGQSTAMADPQQQDAHRQLVHTIGHLKPLGHSGAEAEGITQIYWDAYGGNAELWQGRTASEARLKALAVPPRVLHLASHGFYLPATDGSVARPLTLSGLALAGANKGMQGHLSSDGEDGILYALEVQNLNLEGTEVVALSACDTGKGVLDYSDGVYGLVRAFRVAGARRVLMTLWPVEDAHASDFMLRFYKNWLTPEKGRNPNRDPIIALQQTRQAFLNHPDPALREPRVWAPYVLVETRAGR